MKTIPAATTRRRWLAGASAVALGALSAAGAAADEPPSPSPGDLVRWPPVTLLDGSRWPAPRDDATLVVFFTLTCPFCARHNDRVQALHRQLRGQAMRVLGVAQDAGVEHTRTYLQRRGLDFAVTLDHAALHAALSRRRGVPLSCVVDRAQRLREVIRGEMAEDDVLALAKWARAV